MLYGTVVGNLGRDAELRVTSGGKSVLNFSVAAKNGRDKENAIWVRCALWGTRGEKLQEHLKKGTKVTCMGVISTREYEGKTQVECDVQELVLGGSAQGQAHTAKRPSDESDSENPF